MRSLARSRSPPSIDQLHNTTFHTILVARLTHPPTPTSFPPSPFPSFFLCQVKPAAASDADPDHPASYYPPLPPWGLLDPTPAHRRARVALEEALDALAYMSLEPSPSPLLLLVQAPPGNGKTTLLSHLARRLLEAKEEEEEIEGEEEGPCRPVFLSLPSLLAAGPGEGKEGGQAAATAVVEAVDKALLPPPCT